MPRTTITLPDDLYALLEDEARRLGISVSGVVSNLAAKELLGSEETSGDFLGRDRGRPRHAGGSGDGGVPGGGSSSAVQAVLTTGARRRE